GDARRGLQGGASGHQRRQQPIPAGGRVVGIGKKGPRENARPQPHPANQQGGSGKTGGGIQQKGPNPCSQQGLGQVSQNIVSAGNDNDRRYLRHCPPQQRRLRRGSHRLLVTAGGGRYLVGGPLSATKRRHIIVLPVSMTYCYLRDRGGEPVGLRSAQPSYRLKPSPPAGRLWRRSA